MSHCVYLFDCPSPAVIFFKGRMFCREHAKEIRKNMETIVASKEKQENRVISSNEEISLNNPRVLRDSNGRITRIRGTHLVIRKKDLENLGV